MKNLVDNAEWALRTAAMAGRWKSNGLHFRALMERSEPMGEFVREEHNAADGAERWNNGKYTVAIRRHKDDPVFGSRHGMVQLGISANNGKALHDWRDFQAIKNRFAGEDAEAFELYPAERRLVDTSNYYTLWCFPRLTLKVGISGRRVCDSDAAVSPQRAFPHEPDFDVLMPDPVEAMLNRALAVADDIAGVSDPAVRSVIASTLVDFAINEIALFSQGGKCE